MRRPPARVTTWILSVAVVCVAVRALPARGDVVVLKDGSRVEGSLERSDDGYDVTGADGKVRRLTTAQIKSIEVRPQATPEDAKRRLESLRRAAENVTDAKVAITRYNDFLRQFGKTPQAAEARADLAQWQDRLDRHMTRAGGKWVTPEELGSLQEQSQGQAVKAHGLIVQGRLREATPLIQQALDVDPKNASALYLRGVVLFRQDQLGPARKAFDQVAQLVPDHAPTLNNLAIILWKQKNEPAALKSYDAAPAGDGPGRGGERAGRRGGAEQRRRGAAALPRSTANPRPPGSSSSTSRSARRRWRRR